MLFRLAVFTCFAWGKKKNHQQYSNNLFLLYSLGFVLVLSRLVEAHDVIEQLQRNSLSVYNHVVPCLIFQKYRTVISLMSYFKMV